MALPGVASGHRRGRRRATSVRRRGTFGYFTASFGGWKLAGEPYTVAPGDKFHWFRSRMVGGRTNHYGRISLRFADYDFAPYTRDGLGTDWPITYDELAPYYDKAERFIGVTGSKEGIRSAPDGIFQTCPPPRVHEMLVQRAAKKLNIPCIPSRLAVITQPTNGRPACHYCGQCGRGCISASNYSSSQVQVFPAMKTGRVKLFTNAMARELITDSSGKVTRRFLYRQDHAHRKTDPLPQRGGGLRRLRIGAPAAQFEIARASQRTRERLRARGPQPDRQRRAMAWARTFRRWTDCRATTPTAWAACISTCRGGCGTPRTRSSRAATTSRSAAVSTCRASARSTAIATGTKATARISRPPSTNEYGAWFGIRRPRRTDPQRKYLSARSIPDVVDQYGIPVLRFHFKWTDSELKQAQHMHDTFQSLLETMGGKVTTPRPNFMAGEGISMGGEIIHELGTVRMGKRSGEIGVEQILPGARSEESVRGRRRAVRQQSGQESHADHHRAGLAYGRVSGRRNEEGQCLKSLGAICCRRIALSITAGTLSLEAAQHVHGMAAEEKAAHGVYKPKALNAHEYKTLAKLADYIVPADERVGRRGGRGRAANGSI